MKQINILFITHRIPFPANDGGLIATLQTLKALLKESHIHIKLLCLNPEKDKSNTLHLPSYFYDDLGIETLQIDTRIKPFAALLHLLKGKSYNMSRFESLGFNKLISDTLKKQHFDIVHFENLFSTNPLHELDFGTSKTVVRTHNIEHLIWKNLAQHTKNIFKKFYLKKLANQLAKYERKTLQKADKIISISNNDELRFETLFGMRATNIEPPLSPDKYIGITDFDLHKIYHVASMDWMPNVESMNWFLHEIWPLIYARNPRASLHIAGKKMPKDFLDMKRENVFVSAFVEDLYEYTSDKNILVVPLRSGSGIRIKIMEAMAAGKCIVATSKALEGIDAIDKKDVWIANECKDFAATVLFLLKDEKLCKQTGQNAQMFALKNFHENIIVEKWKSVYNNLISENKQVQLGN